MLAEMLVGMRTARLRLAGMGTARLRLAGMGTARLRLAGMGTARLRLAYGVVLVARTASADVEADALAHLDRGIAAYRIDDFTTARKELDAAIELVPDRANPYRWRALVERGQHDCVNALVDVEAFLSRAPAGDPRIGEMTELRDHCVERARVIQPAPAPPPAPVYERWWFWTAIGAVVATSVVITIAATRDRESTLPTVQCDPNGCHL